MIFPIADRPTEEFVSARPGVQPRAAFGKQVCRRDGKRNLRHEGQERAHDRGRHRDTAANDERLLHTVASAPVDGERFERIRQVDPPSVNSTVDFWGCESRTQAGCAIAKNRDVSRVVSPLRKGRRLLRPRRDCCFHRRRHRWRCCFLRVRRSQSCVRRPKGRWRCRSCRLRRRWTI